MLESPSSSVTRTTSVVGVGATRAGTYHRLPPRRAIAPLGEFRREIRRDRRVGLRRGSPTQVRLRAIVRPTRAAPLASCVRMVRIDCTPMATNCNHARAVPSVNHRLIRRQQVHGRSVRSVGRSRERCVGSTIAHLPQQRALETLRARARSALVVVYTWRAFGPLQCSTTLSYAS